MHVDHKGYVADGTFSIILYEFDISFNSPIDIWNNFYFSYFPYVKDPMYMLLDVIEVSGRKSTLLSIKYLLETSVIYQSGSSISRRSFSILKEKLAQLDGAVSSQTELVSSLTKFKEDFQQHEM